MIRCRFVSRCRCGLVSRCGFGCVSGVVFGVLGLSFVFHVSNETVAVGGVGDDLDTAIGKVDSVRALGVVTITGFGGFEVGIGVVILDGIGVLVLRGDIGVGGLLVCRGSRVVRWGRVVSNSDTGDESEDGQLRRKEFSHSSQWAILTILGS